MGLKDDNLKKRVVTKVETPSYGSSKMVSRFNKEGNLKSQKFVERDSSGKKTQVVKKEYTSGNSELGMKIKRAAARAGSAFGLKRDLEQTREGITKIKRR